MCPVALAVHDGIGVVCTNRPFSIATTQHRLVRLIRAQVAPRVAPILIRLSPVRAYAIRTISQLDIRYRSSHAVHEGHPALPKGPKAGDRLHDTPIARDGQPCWLQEALADPILHLLLCGPIDDWPENPLPLFVSASPAW